jgi:hypothetical protein
LAETEAAATRAKSIAKDTKRAMPKVAARGAEISAVRRGRKTAIERNAEKVDWIAVIRADLKRGHSTREAGVDARRPIAPRPFNRAKRLSRFGLATKNGK